MLPVLPLNPAGLAGSATKGPAQLWTPGLPSSAIRLLFLNPFPPHPFTNPSAITIPSPPSTWSSLTPQQLNSQQQLRSNAPISSPFSWQCWGCPVQLPNICMRNNLLLFPVSWSCCLPGCHLIQLGWITEFGVISLPFCSHQAGDQTTPGDSSGNTFLLQRRLNLLPKQRLGWESHDECNFSSKNLTAPPASRGCCGACFVIKIRVCVQLECYCWQSPSGLSPA